MTTRGASRLKGPLSSRSASGQAGLSSADVCRVPAGIECHVMALAYEFFSDIGNDPLRASIELGRYAFPQMGRFVRSSCETFLSCGNSQSVVRWFIGTARKGCTRQEPHKIRIPVQIASLPSAVGGATTPTTGNTDVVNHGSPLSSWNARESNGFLTPWPESGPPPSADHGIGQARVRTPETHLQRRLRNRSRWEKAGSARIGQSAERTRTTSPWALCVRASSHYKWEMRDGAHHTLRL